MAADDQSLPWLKSSDLFCLSLFCHDLVQYVAISRNCTMFGCVFVSSPEADWSQLIFCCHYIPPLSLKAISAVQMSTFIPLYVLHLVALILCCHLGHFMNLSELATSSLIPVLKIGLATSNSAKKPQWDRRETENKSLSITLSMSKLRWIQSQWLQKFHLWLTQGST